VNWGVLYRSIIQVNGKNNRVIIEENVRLFNSTLIVRATNSEIRICSDSTVGSAYMVCMGKHNKLIIGRECMIADNVEIWNTDSHRILDLDTGELNNKSVPVMIGDHVWLGKNSIVLKGVHIGDGAVVGMNSIVTKEVASNCVVAGNPARLIRENVKWDGHYTTE